MYKDSEITIAEASEITGIPYSYIYNRIVKGYSLDEIIQTFENSKNSLFWFCTPYVLIYSIHQLASTCQSIHVK